VAGAALGAHIRPALAAACSPPPSCPRARPRTFRGRRGTRTVIPELQHSPEGGALNAAISRSVVRLLAEAAGRGPTQARTTIDRDLIVVVLQDSLTTGERYLARSDRGEQVLGTRRAYQDAMRADCIASIEDLTGRTVRAFMSVNHLDPDVAAEVFVLEPEAAEQPA
jgi:uncharacterized protein YbcI